MNLQNVKKQSYLSRKKIYSGKLKGLALELERKKFNRLEKIIRTSKVSAPRVDQAAAPSKVKVVAAKPKKTRKAKKTSRRVASRPKKQAFDPKQGFLPSFLGQLNLVGMNELLADRIFKAMTEEIKANGSQLTSNTEMSISTTVGKTSKKKMA